jgi:two-component system, OmpR family, manganese sensing sensor histidine kinase
MALVIGSILTSNSQFKALRLRLLLSYLGVMVTILGTTGITIHEVVTRNIYQQLDRHLLTLAETAAQTLHIVKHEASEHKYGHDDDDKYKENKTKNIANLMEEYQTNNLVITSNLPNHFQGVEWFDEKHKLLVKEGNLFSDWSLDTKLIKSELDLIEKEQIRSLILPVMYINHHTGKQQIAGYIRVSESIQPLELELSHLRWGLGLGGIFALILTGLGGIWLTSQAIEPVEKSFEQLKQFTSDASHELRSPLTVIKTSIEIMQSHSENLELQDRKKVNAIAHSADQMTHLVEDLLLLAKMEQPTIKKTWIKVPLEEILEDLIDELEIKFEQKNLIY